MFNGGGGDRGGSGGGTYVSVCYRKRERRVGREGVQDYF